MARPGRPGPRRIYCAVRLDPPQDEWLTERMAELDLERSELVRWALDAAWLNEDRWLPKRVAEKALGT